METPGYHNVETHRCVDCIESDRNQDLDTVWNALALACEMISQGDEMSLAANKQFYQAFEALKRLKK